MKTLLILCLSLLLGGCGWFGNNQNGNGQNGNTNQAIQPEEQNTVKKSEMKDLFNYFDEQKIPYTDAKDIDVVDVNAHEGKTFKYEGKNVYVYRMNMQDEKINKWMDEVTKTGKVTINQDGKEATYDAIINNEYMLVSESGVDLNKLSESFRKFEMK